MRLIIADDDCCAADALRPTVVLYSWSSFQRFLISPTSDSPEMKGNEESHFVRPFFTTMRFRSF